MKKQLILWVWVAALVFSFSASSFAETITLRFAHQNPESGVSSKICVDRWIEQVEEATDGKVKIQAFYGETLVKGKDMWTGVKSGITDIGWCFHGYWSGMTPLTDVISLPALPFRTAEQGSEVLWKLYERFPEIQKEFEDVKVLLFYTSAPYTLITRDKPVKKMEDLKGMKIRMTGGPPTDMVRKLGGTPMLIPMPDCYISLQKGVIDGMGAPWEAIQVWRFYEVVDHYTEVPFPAVYFSIAMNKNSWNRLPKDVQEDIMSVSGLKGSKFWGRQFFDAMRDRAQKKIKAEGDAGNVYQLSDEERKRWVEVGGEPVWNEWVDKMEGKGYGNAQTVLDTTLELAKEAK